MTFLAGCVKPPPPEVAKLAPQGDVKVAQAEAPKEPDWHSHGRCKSAVEATNDGDVLIVTSDADHYAVFLPPHPMVQIDGTEASFAKSRGLVLKVTYPSVDAHVSLVSVPAASVVSEQRSLAAFLGATEKLIANGQKGTQFARQVNGVPGAMVATLSGKLPAANGSALPFSQWTTIRQRPSDKRLFTLTVTATAPTPESSRMWQGLLSLPQNPTFDPKPDATAEPPGSPATMPATTLM